MLKNHCFGLRLSVDGRQITDRVFTNCLGLFGERAREIGEKLDDLTDWIDININS